MSEMFHSIQGRATTLVAAALMVLVAALPATARVPAGRHAATAPHAGGSLAAFRSEAELARFLRRLRGPSLPPPPPPPPPPSPPASAPSPVSPIVAAAPPAQVTADAAEIATTGARAGQANITNNQEANVDEGDIVKARGDLLIILRRGRLFTVSLAGGAMRPVDQINAFPPGDAGDDAWYDEMLLDGDRVVVIGYSYERGGTEINRFRLDAAGHLRFEDAYQLRSNDYYSSENYASRLIGNRLIFYTPLELHDDGDPLASLPGLRKWRRGMDRDAPFRPIANARQIYIVPTMRSAKESEIDTLHSVTSCDLTAPVLSCSAIGVLGPESRTFYVSSDAVYLWVSEDSGQGHRHGAPEAFLYRLPFGREPPSAIGARGEPVDQFSFREDVAEGQLNVLLREDGGGDAMGNPEVSGGRVSLLRLPIARLGDGSRAAPAAYYRSLPTPPDQNWSFHNRFVGDYVLYGAGAFGEGRDRANVFVVPLAGGAVSRIALGHGVERIEALGSDALVVGAGTGDSLGFSAIELPRQGAPRRGDVFTLPAAAQGETRSHAFFFRPSAPDGSSGLLGLPISKPVEPAYERFFGSAASMLFLRRDARRFAAAGELDAQVGGTADDACEASCTDWYGNARPIFLGDRVFALLGYELVEGRLDGGTIHEAGRVNFAPRAAPAGKE